MKVFVKEIAFDKLSAQKAADKVISLINAGRSGYVVTPNTEILARAKNERFFRVLSGADIVLCDGIGVCFMALMKGKVLKRTTGIDLAGYLLKKAAELKIPVFLYGAKDGVAQRARENLIKTYDGLDIVGVCNGFESEELAKKMIKESRAKIVFVCTSSPLQEFFAKSAAKESSGVIYIALGGALDIFSGDKKRAPVIFQKLGLEWAYRFAREPYRIKRFVKTLIENK